MFDLVSATAAGLWSAPSVMILYTLVSTSGTTTSRSSRARAVPASSWPWVSSLSSLSTLKMNERSSAMMWMIFRKISPPTVEALLMRSISPIRPGRTDSRKLTQKPAVSFTYRVA